MREIEIKRDILYENELDEKHLNLIYILRFKLLFDINDRIAPLFFLQIKNSVGLILEDLFVNHHFTITDASQFPFSIFAKLHSEGKHFI